MTDRQLDEGSRADDAREERKAEEAYSEWVDDRAELALVRSLLLDAQTEASMLEAARADDQRAITEAIRQRDEAVRLLREQTMTVGWALDYSEDEFGDKPPLHEFDPGAFAQARAHDEQARAFLANFKEDSTND